MVISKILKVKFDYQVKVGTTKRNKESIILCFVLVAIWEEVGEREREIWTYVMKRERTPY